MSLWEEALNAFVKGLRSKPEDAVAIERFIQDKSSVEDVRQSLISLQSDSNRKYGSTDCGGKGISAKWIRHIMENLDKFTSFGDAVMPAAPQSVGLAWFAIRNVLGAIQNDYKLYLVFNTGLQDIMDMLVLVRTYDDLYKGQAMKASGGICDETRENQMVIAQYISADAPSKDGRLRLIENTILRLIYEHALDYSEDDLPLQTCNRLFSNTSKHQARDAVHRSKDTGKSARTQNASSDNALDFIEIAQGLVKVLGKTFVLIIDAIDGLTEEEQTQLATQLLELSKGAEVQFKILLLCFPRSQVRHKLSEENVCQVQLSDYNDQDIKLVLEKSLDMLAGISSSEREEIERDLMKKTGHQIGYVTQVAQPFLRTPLRRPISHWLEDLPENVNETYSQHLHQLSPNYRRLLREALRWTLTANRPTRIEEIMEAYSGVYLNSSTDDGQSGVDVDLRLYQEQIEEAGGPFLEVREDEFVVLADAQAVRKFCKPEINQADGNLEGTLCVRCKTATKFSDKFSISVAEEHLEMAITCCKS